MTLNEYFNACDKFAADSAEWARCDPYKMYVATGDGEWAETCDNHENGISVAWAFGLPHGKINPAIVREAYIDSFRAEYEQGIDESWDDEQMNAVFQKYEDCVINENGNVFCDEWDAIVNLMDDEIREQLHNEIAPCSNQKFFSAYEREHAAKFGEPWELSKQNPTY